MEEIRVIEKPEWVSWEDIQRCIYISQQTNVKKGFDMLFGHITPEELEKAVSNGYCFVALNDNNKVVGTASLTISNLEFWWHKGRAGQQCYEGILPSYRGSDVYFELHEHIEKKADELGLNVLWASTSESNKVVIKTSKLSGWKVVRYSPTRKGANYYSIIFAKWKDGCPYSDWRINIMYQLSKLAIRALYKPDNIRRFHFLNSY